MKTLRIINQNLEDSQLTRNICLEGNDYEVVIKVKSVQIESGFKKGENIFNQDMNQYCGDRQSDETIIGFVHGKNNIHPIREHEVAYIVNDEGKTIERIYGQYQKY